MSIRFAGGVFLAFFMLLAVPRIASAQDRDIVATVSGSGASIEEAKADAVRQALQYAFKQLVVVDRVISGDTLVRDKVLSTMNGYVEKFEELGIDRSGPTVVVRARITLSASRIENFIGVAASGGGAFDGPLISNEQARRVAQASAEQGQAKARGEIFDRLFHEFPWGTHEIRLTKVNISDQDPNTLVIDLEQSFKPQFLRALRGTLEALAEYRCQTVARGEPFGVHRKNPGDQWSLREVAGIMVSRVDCQNTAQPNVFYSAPVDPHDTICIGSAATIDCFALGVGRYCESCRVSGGRVAIFGRFLDSSGRSALTNGDCIVSAATYERNSENSIARNSGTVFLQEKNRSVTLVAIGINAEPKRLRIQVKAGDVDLRRASQFVAVAAMVGDGLLSPARRDDLVPFMAASADQPATPRSGCALVDDAVRRRAAVR